MSANPGNDNNNEDINLDDYLQLSEEELILKQGYHKQASGLKYFSAVDMEMDYRKRGYDVRKCKDPGSDDRWSVFIKAKRKPAPPPKEYATLDDYLSKPAPTPIEEGEEDINVLREVRAYYWKLMQKSGKTEEELMEEEEEKEREETKDWGGSYGCPYCKHHWETRKTPKIVICPRCGRVVE